MTQHEFSRDILPLRDRMFRYARSLLLSAVEAEDVVHDLLERLWRDRERIGACRQPVSFVLTVVRNRCYDLLRQRRARLRCDMAAAETAERQTTDATDRWEARNWVRRAMERLPERQREVLLLKDIEGYPTHEVAALLATDEAQVRVLLSRARRGLREELKRMMGDENIPRN